MIATDVNTNWSNVAVDGNEVIYSVLGVPGAAALIARPKLGGAAVEIFQGQKEWFTAHDGQVFFTTPESAPTGQGVASVDRGTGERKHLSGSFGTTMPVATRDELFVIRDEDAMMVRIDRATFAHTEHPLPVPRESRTRPIDLVVAGDLVAYIGADGAVWAYEIAEDRYARLTAPPIAPSLIAGNGEELLMLSGDTLFRLERDHAPEPVGSLPADTTILAFDRRSLVWSNYNKHEPLHITARDGTNGCSTLFAGRIGSIALDENAVFVNHYIPEGNLINRDAALARLPR